MTVCASSISLREWDMWDSGREGEESFASSLVGFGERNVNGCVGWD